ncbi:MAG: hypothetical protein A2087_06635 [Spirochaetes bacterium GWD1_61_31]|nr:MAG: hypothetical protein A2Y37_08835 [Spirochaetes bacterium GWB1_60_80]OHD31877.1 MAG: hypothetical protein A2004_10220 [Spirochaetes bacterium GWC1_61_12]OHD40026.1 MAG: hypothetical protein A2087_06635 [Spirochaetes bacterium GWD1_61_31]OHD42320.1 MAG: hypothetical protein A2Y35_11365 [Spirochaetes bacterium GWE1_60_18]OHD58470.1 MAG: hypothetical protein A2Y32_06870 [Spirochaetes bacterium GWF1_60_12]HAW85461.1 hypothetical protein [Spirochaetaceae bacterium]
MTVLFLALRSLFLQRRRYVLMFLAIFIGFMLMTVIHSLTSGMLETVKTKAARYFSGHISLTGYEAGQPSLVDVAGLRTSLLDAGLPLRTIAPRTIYYRSDASLFFAGESIRQRRLLGIDFKLEAAEMANLSFLDGSIQDMVTAGQDGILISEAAARLLGARVGDDIILYLTTDSGQYNSSTLIIRGIFRETSLFGYVAYMRQQDLNRMLQRPADAATDLALYTRQGVDPEALLERIRPLLITYRRLLPRLPTKASLYEALAVTDWGQGPVLAILTLQAHLNQITIMLDAFWTVTWFILAVFILVVMVGILNTYRVLVYERTREIGTLRALGMQRAAVQALFLVEATVLALLASVTGFLVGSLVLAGLSRFDVSALPGTGLIADRGHLQPFIDWRLTGLTLTMMIGAVVLAASGPARQASRVTPAEALRTAD